MTARGSKEASTLVGEHQAASLSLEDVGKTFQDPRGDHVAAVDRVDLSIESGSFVSIVGPSGCGKTTLLRIVAGLLSPTRGRVVVGGKPVEGPIEDFGMVFQSPVLLPWRTALGNVLLPIEMLGRNRRRYEKTATELFALVGLQGFESKRPRELSGGMQMRVALCRALIHDPSVLLLDEPFSGIDEFTREGLNDHLLTLWETSHKTAVLVTHNIEEAVYLSDRVVVLSPRPARVTGIVDVGLPRPRGERIRYSVELLDEVRKVKDLLRS